MTTRTRWMTVSWLTILLVLVGILPAAAHPGLPPAAPFGPREAVPQAWGIGAPAPTAGWLMGGASVDSCTFYTIGGNLPGGVAVPNVDLYNPATNVWTPRAPMPTGVYGIQPSVSGSRIYVVGGYADSSIPVYAVTSTLIYDSLSNSWSAGAPIPVGEFGIGTAAQATSNGKVYVIGGDDGNADSNTTNYEYNIAANTWTLRAPMPTARENNVAVTLNGKIYVAGGAQAVDPDYNGLTTFEVYDPAANTWASLAPMQEGRVSPGIATDGVYIYVYGGADSLGPTFSSLATAERYNPATNTWAYVDAMSAATAGMGNAYAAGRIYASSGINAVNGAFTRIDTNQYLVVGASGCQPTAVQLTTLEGPAAPRTGFNLWPWALLVAVTALIVMRRFARSH